MQCSPDRAVHTLYVWGIINKDPNNILFKLSFYPQTEYRPVVIRGIKMNTPGLAFRCQISRGPALTTTVLRVSWNRNLSFTRTSFVIYALLYTLSCVRVCLRIHRHQIHTLINSVLSREYILISSKLSNRMGKEAYGLKQIPLGE